MTKIYDQHRAAFANVSAYVILNKQGARVASVAFKYPRDGAGRLYAYVHIFGSEMVRGFAAGGGYDKHTAAVSSAVSRIKDGLDVNRWLASEVAEYDALRGALAKDGGHRWDGAAQAAGFTVLQAV
ncbi:hypothetical protein HU230_0012380 [Bradyrhizobium quebecense]|uniref:Uncharacterized protein n=1 Tax=Bradyrhizobium quebecense TaxID=2748629 RepID=A0A974AGS8_9BRAD|nr:hypothetical protein [Bradyrhizobium quebecense]UGA46785.1 hypothetical protein HU230_0012380 [Bradyrhizobium quebecense]